MLIHLKLLQNLEKVLQKARVLKNCQSPRIAITWGNEATTEGKDNTE